MTPTSLNKSEGIALFTDGSAWNKDKSGGWAWIAIDAFDGEAQGSGAVRGTTNNQMEMMAWIEGLTELHETLGPCEVIVYSDSEYVGLGAMDRRRKRNCNVDLWILIDIAIDRHLYVEFSHVRGHTGHIYNEMVDKLAGEARRAGNANTHSHSHNKLSVPSRTTGRRAKRRRRCASTGSRTPKPKARRKGHR